MKKIYEHADDLHVRARYIYKKSGSTDAYSDAARTEKTPLAVLQDLFRKGMIIDDGGVEYLPVSFEVDTGVGIVTYVKADDTTGTTAVLATLESTD